MSFILLPCKIHCPQRNVTFAPSRFKAGGLSVAWMGGNCYKQAATYRNAGRCRAVPGEMADLRDLPSGGSSVGNEGSS